MALRRLGHSVHIIDECHYVSTTWRSTPARVIRKLFRPILVRELLLEAQRLADTFKPHWLFVFKGNSVLPEVITLCKRRGVRSVNFYPDVSFVVHGRYLPKALPLYDHIFTTKSWGIADMQSQLGVKSISYLEHGFDPDIHRPLPLSDEDRQTYACDVVFIGTWSPKKEDLIGSLRKKMPQATIKIWGNQWEKSRTPELCPCVMGADVIGDEYAKALLGGSIALGLLSEKRKGASSGDQTTSRTFNIPACGAFMLHERTQEALRYFLEGEEAAFFASPDELARQVAHYLGHPQQRERVARAGRQRCLLAGYSLDNRMQKLVDYFSNSLEQRPKA
jgi:spore maturation protein CgeB